MKFENVTLVKKANLYFDGQVNSRTVEFQDGTHKTLGIMMPGSYTFGTEAAEIMEIMAGSCDIKLKGENEFRAIKAGESFDVPAHSSFDIKVHEVTDYCCSYIQ